MCGKLHWDVVILNRYFQEGLNRKQNLFPQVSCFVFFVFFKPLSTWFMQSLWHLEFQEHNVSLFLLDKLFSINPLSIYLINAILSWGYFLLLYLNLLPTLQSRGNFQPVICIFTSLYLWAKWISMVKTGEYFTLLIYKALF